MERIAGLELTQQKVNEASAQAYVVLGVVMHFLSSPEKSKSAIGVLQGRLGPGTIIPLHRHNDAEVLHILHGSLEVYQEPSGWETALAGETVTIPSGVNHALRNTSSTPTSALTITGEALYGFFRELAEPIDASFVPMPPTVEEMQRLFKAAAKYRYGMATPEENAAIGISLH